MKNIINLEEENIDKTNQNEKILISLKKMNQQNFSLLDNEKKSRNLILSLQSNEIKYKEEKIHLTKVLENLKNDFDNLQFSNEKNEILKNNHIIKEEEIINDLNMITDKYNRLMEEKEKENKINCDLIKSLKKKDEEIQNLINLNKDLKESKFKINFELEKLNYEYITYKKNIEFFKEEFFNIEENNIGSTNNKMTEKDLFYQINFIKNKIKDLQNKIIINDDELKSIKEENIRIKKYLESKEKEYRIYKKDINSKIGNLNNDKEIKKKSDNSEIERMSQIISDLELKFSNMELTHKNIIEEKNIISLNNIAQKDFTIDELNKKYKNILNFYNSLLSEFEELFLSNEIRNFEKIEIILNNNNFEKIKKEEPLFKLINK